MIHIKTARNIKTINQWITEGYTAIVRCHVPDPRFFISFIILKNKISNEIISTHDRTVYTRRGEINYSTNEWDEILSIRDYYPYKFENSYAAYIVPKQIEIGERVVIDDLIEDFYGGSFWYQAIRLDSLEAIWDGNDLIIQYDVNTDGVCNWVG